MSITSGRMLISPRPVDTEPDVVSAYALRRVSSEYTGPVIRVKRSSDNIEQDIYLKKGRLDVETLALFGGDRVVRWYDQKRPGEYSVCDCPVGDTITNIECFGLAYDKTQLVLDTKMIGTGQPTPGRIGDTKTLTQTVSAPAYGIYNDSVTVNNKIVFMPYTAPDICVYDGTQYRFIPCSTSYYKYTKGATVVGTKVIFPPLFQEFVGIFNLETETFTFGGSTGKTHTKFNGACYAGNDLVVFSPHRYPNIGLYTVSTDTFVDGPSIPNPATNNFRDAIFVESKNIVLLVPYNYPTFAWYDIASNTFVASNVTPTNEYTGCYIPSEESPEDHGIVVLFNTTQAFEWNPETDTKTLVATYSGTSQFDGRAVKYGSDVFINNHVYNILTRSFRSTTDFPNNDEYGTPGLIGNTLVYPPSVPELYPDVKQGQFVETTFEPGTLVPEAQEVYMAPTPLQSITRAFPLDAQYSTPTVTTGSSQTHATENPNLGNAVLADGALATGPYEMDGYTVESSSVQDDRRPPIDALNKTNSGLDDCWHAYGGLPDWISITYPSPVMITYYSLTSRNVLTDVNMNVVWAPYSWTLEASSDGINWMVLDSKYRTIDLYGNNVTQMYNISANGVYQHYRIHVTEAFSNNVISTGYVAIGQWRLYTYTPPSLCYALSRIIPGYSGPLCKVRRVSDDVEMDVYGFGNTEFLDSGGEMRVVTWYDQAGSNHAAAPTTDTQPMLYNSENGWTMYLDGTGFSNRKYFEFSSINAQAVHSQFLVRQFNPIELGIEGYATVFTHSGSAEQTGMRFEYQRVFDPNNPGYFVYPTDSIVWWNGTQLSSPPTDATYIPSGQWNSMVAYRHGSTQPIDTIGRNYYDGQYRDFTGYISSFVVYESFVKDHITDTASRPIPRNLASVGLGQGHALVEGFIQKSDLSMEEICEYIVSNGPQINGVYSTQTSMNTFGVQMDYYVHRGTLHLTSAQDVSDIFTEIKDIRPAFVVIDGDLTIDIDILLTPPVRKLFCVVYCTGSLTNHGTISMTARGANHSGTGDSGGLVEPRDIVVDAKRRSVVPAEGGSGGTGGIAYVGGSGGTVVNGSGGGGRGGTGGSGGDGDYGEGNGLGAQGTSYSGGSGGGGGHIGTRDLGNLYYRGQDAERYGGAGGISFGGEPSAGNGRGAGNPDNGCGGTLLMFASSIQGQGHIESQGSEATGQGSGGGSIISGGGSGGGAVHCIVSQSISNAFDVSGGSRKATRSGLGGDGSVTVQTTSVLDTEGLIGWWTGESWTGTQWTDLSGAGNHVTQITNTALTTNEVLLNGHRCLSGGTSDDLVWPTTILPEEYTFFHVAKWNGASKSRIFQGTNINWLSGFHYNNERGVAYHKRWITPANNQPNIYSDWLVSTDQNALYRGNGVDLTSNPPGNPSYDRLAVNTGNQGHQKSDFAIAEVLVYNRTLTLDEITGVETYLQNKYALSGAEMGTEIMRLDAPTLTQTWPDNTLLPVPFLPMTANTDTIQDEVYVASGSSFLSGYPTFYGVFDQNDGSWWTASSSTLYNTDGTYAGSVTTNALKNGSVVTYAGEWLQLQCPRFITVEQLRVTTRDTHLTRGPEEYIVVGSDNGVDWYWVFEAMGRSVWTVDGYTDLLEEPVSYRYWRLVITKKIDGGDPLCSIGEFGLFSRESRRATLVNQPSIITKNTLQYVEFNGSNQYADIQLQNPAGAWGHSVSFWVKMNVEYTEKDYNIFDFGQASTGKHLGFNSYAATGLLQYYFYYYYIRVNVQLKKGTWYHIVVTYNGGSTESDHHVYIQGVDQIIVASQPGAPNFDANMTGSIGRERARNQRYLPGAISQFRVYNGALSQEQVTDIYRSGVAAHELEDAVVALTMNTWQAPDTRQSSIGSWGVFNNVRSRCPVVSTENALEFTRAQEQFLRCPELTLNVSRGFTAIAYVKFSGSPGSYECLFDLGSGSPSDNILFDRNGTSGSLRFKVFDGSDQQQITASVITTDWAVYGCRQSDTLSIWKDGIESAQVASTLTLTDRTSTKSRIGKSNWDVDYFQGSMRGLLVWDRALPDEAMVALSQWLRDTYS